MVINMLANAWYMTLQPKDSQFLLKRCVSGSKCNQERGHGVSPVLN